MHLRSVIAKLSDLDEAITLFEEKRCKPCAMMTCSLIECSLYKRSKKRKGEKKRCVREPFRRLETQVPEVGYTVLSLLGTTEAFDYFFRSADDFNRGAEGELNRHSLMHGMMYDKISQTVCVKLFMLLLSVERLMKVI